MSDINLEFTVSNNSIEFTVDPIDLTFSPQDIQLTINPSYQPGAGGNVGELQYNNGSLLAGIPTATYNGSNLSLGNVANLKITGGVNGYFLQTDGTGNLNWAAGGGGGGNGTPGGSNTQIQYNDNGTFGGNAGFTFNEVSGNVAIPGNLSVVGNITGNVQQAYLANFATVANSVAGANVTGQVSYAAVANSVAGANVSGQVNFAAVANSVAVGNVVGIGNIATINLTGSSSNVLYGNGIFAPIPTANFANYAGNVTVNAQPNITSLGNLVSLTLTSNSVVLGNGASVANAANSDIAIGNGAYAAEYTVGYHAIAIGGQSTYAANGAIAIGDYAGKFAANSAANARHGIAIGHAAGYGNNRGANSIALGISAGVNQKANSIAIGQLTGGNIGVDSIAIGRYADGTANNAIVLNASGNFLYGNTANTFTVKPIRNATQGNILYYDPTSGEITYNTSSPSASAYYPYTGLETTAPAANGTFNYDIINGAYQDIGQLNGNFILNVRGNSTATFNNTISTNTAVNLTLVCFNGSGNAFGITDLYVDSSDANVSTSFSGASPYVPPTATFIEYKITLFKSTANTYRAWINATPMYGLA